MSSVWPGGRICGLIFCHALLVPEWTLSGGLARGGWVYVHESGARAYIHVNDDGYIDVATWDPGSGDERAFPDREALETIVGMDLERMRESGRGDDQAMLALSGLGGFSSVRSYRGRKKKWDRATLARFVDNVVEHGVPVASKQWGVKERQGRAVMQKAKIASLPTSLTLPAGTRRHADGRG